MPRRRELALDTVDWSALRVASLARLSEGPVLDSFMGELRSWVEYHPSAMPTSHAALAELDIVFGRDLLNVRTEDRDNCFAHLRDHVARIRLRLAVDVDLPPGSVPTRGEVTVEEIEKYLAGTTNLVAKLVAPWHRREVVEREVMTFTPGSYVPESERLAFFFFQPIHGSENEAEGNRRP